MFAAYSAGMLLAAAMAVSSPSMGQAVEAPKVSPGDTWKYQTVDQWSGRPKTEAMFTVLGVTEEYVRMEIEMRSFAANGKPTRYPPFEMTNHANLDMVHVANGKNSTRVNFAWPLFPGKQWRYEYATSTPDNRITTTFRMAAEVTGWEDVETSAGRFRALKVVHTGTADAGPSVGVGKNAWTSWYSPEAKNYVRYQVEVTGPDGAPGLREVSELTAITVRP
ncbi:hypothetical protein [Variovorax sp.]|jgi:hypothetical protein|uniref:hypothetical protein n=1 Tax=Variovorax sp. TaxID=1871043 RepID=UPI00120D7C3C|nr:hypothetical protein [Variovorax sp.]TAJ65708.1 MAG: hypothetical protein EPO53_09570 [Variovorax sp.]